MSSYLSVLSQDTSLLALRASITLWVIRSHSVSSSFILELFSSTSSKSFINSSKKTTLLCIFFDKSDSLTNTSSFFFLLNIHLSLFYTGMPETLILPSFALIYLLTFMPIYPLAPRKQYLCNPIIIFHHIIFLT